MAANRLGVPARFMVVVALVAGFSVQSYADGFVIIVPPHPPVPMPVPRIVQLAVRKHNVTVDIKGPVVTTEIDQVFYNPNNIQLEGEYLFPIPEGASIKDFTLYINGQPVKAELLDADKARKTYEDIVRRMRDPALLEYSGRGLFKARIFPIPARGERRVVLRYSEILTPDAQVWSYRYPLNTEKFSSAPLEEVSVEVKCQSKRRIQGVYSTSHPGGSLEKQKDGMGFTYSWSDRNVTPDRDFLLHFITATGEVGAAPVVYREAGEDGYFMLLVGVDAPPAGRRAIPKDIVFVMDTSGSMRGKKIRQAKDALRFCLQGLSANDSFNVISFSTGVHAFFENMVQVADTRVKEALQKADELDASGGTNIDEALAEALKMVGGQDDRPAYIVFLTDGQPTVGETSVDGIAGAARKGNRRNARIFSFGVGDRLNAKLLDVLTRDSRGAKVYVGEEEDLEVKLSSFYSKIANPALSDVKMEVRGVEVYDVFPRELPDLFYGQELTVYGRFKGEGKATVVLKGKRGGEAAAMEYEADFASEKNAEPVPRLWAAQKVAFLLEDIRLEGETAALKDEVVRLARKYGIITPYTSMLVLEDEEVQGRPPILREAVKSAADAAPASAPAVEREFRQRAEEARRNFGHELGAGAVRASKDINDLKKAEALSGDIAGMSTGGRYIEQAIRRFAGKTFYKVGDYWQDADYNSADMKTIDLKFLSDEYFALAAKYSELGKYLALGDQVIVVLGGKAYKVSP
ncbi:MAG: VWA domain-containing protein [Planctomycetes bacterium]|nr:VWA domain-containing protein [Planctomycetota bacterium]